VDTPGFDDSDPHMEDSQVMSLIIKWMKRRDNNGMKFGGIIYLSEAGQRKFPLLKELLGNATTRDAILHVETKKSQSGKVYFTNTRICAWSVIDKVVDQPCSDNIGLIWMQLADIAQKLPQRKPKPIKNSIWKQIRSIFS